MSQNHSIRSLYEERCEKHGCRKNAMLMQLLPDQKGRMDLLTELDLNLNLVGRKGVLPVVDLASACPNVTRVCLADNFLNNDSVKSIVDGLVGHPGIEHLDLRRNPISHRAGKMLSTFAGDNKVVGQILLDETLINPALVRIIEEKVRINAESRRATSAPTGRRTSPEEGAAPLRARPVFGAEQSPHPPSDSRPADAAPPRDSVPPPEGDPLLPVCSGPNSIPPEHRCETPPPRAAPPPPATAPAVVATTGGPESIPPEHRLKKVPRPPAADGPPGPGTPDCQPPGGPGSIPPDCRVDLREPPRAADPPAAAEPEPGPVLAALQTLLQAGSTPELRFLTEAAAATATAQPKKRKQRAKAAAASERVGEPTSLLLKAAAATEVSDAMQKLGAAAALLRRASAGAGTAAGRRRRRKRRRPQP